MGDATRSARQGVIETLRLLASEDEQTSYEHAVPWVDITAELLCMWFNDLDVSSWKESVWTAEFTPAERDAVLAFNALYEQRSKSLPLSEGTVRMWLASPAWREVMAGAAAALRAINA